MNDHDGTFLGSRRAIVQRAVIIAICALIIAPVLFNGIATQPTADDIYFANKINEYATSNSAVHEVPAWTRFSAVTSFMAWRYINWSGRFTSDLILGTWIAIADITTSYVASFYLLFILFFASVYVFCRAFLPSWRMAIMLSLIIVTISLLTSPRINEIEYWITVIATYKLGISGLLFVCVYLCHLFKCGTPQHKGLAIVHSTALFIIGILLCGFNEGFMVGVALCAAALVLCTYRHHGRIFSLALCIGVICGVMIVLASPGNDVRVSAEAGRRIRSASILIAHNVPFTLLASSIVGACYDIACLLLLLLLYPMRQFRILMQSIRTHTPFLFSISGTYPFIVICIAYLAIPVAFALPLAWGLGNVGPLRAHGQIILMQLLLLPLFYHSAAILITRNVWPLLTRTVKKITAWKQTKRAHVCCGVVSIAIGVLFAWGVPLIALPNDFDTSAALVEQVAKYDLNIIQIANLAAADIVKGNVRNSYEDAFKRTVPYRHEMFARRAEIARSVARGITSIPLAPYRDPPRTVFVRDVVSTNPQQYHNVAYALFYGAEEVFSKY